MTKKAKTIELPTWITLAVGLLIFGHSAFQIPFSQFDSGLIAFTIFTVFFSSYLQIQIPRTNLYLTVSDTLVFIALLTYGGEVGIVLAVLESIFNSLNLKRKGVHFRTKTLFLNGAISAVTTFVTVFILRHIFDSIGDVTANGTPTNFVKMLCVMAVAQFLMNSLVVSLICAEDSKSFWKIWYKNCFNTLIFYVAGASCAGLVIKSFQRVDPFLVMATFAISAIIYSTYRHYLNDIKETAAKAEQSERERAEEAENHIIELQHYITDQEKTGLALRESRELFRHAAYHDSLTGLPNRNFFIESLKSLLETSQQKPNTKFAILFLDLNRFKTINDSLGHTAGDRLILQVAKRLSSIMQKGGLVARFGGDEFAVILNNIEMSDDAVQVADLIRRKVAAPFSVNGRQVFTNFSIGIALNSQTYKDAEEILRDADIAMYSAKKNSKDYVVFDQTMHLRAVNLLQMETDLRHAVERDELLVYYQPMIDLATMSLMGFEALMRWNHPQRGIVAPIEFIPVAEDTGLIVPLTLWILRKTCEQLVKWQARSPLNKNLIMSVNLSGKHFAQPDLVEQIRKILVETQVNPACLKMEITESAIMENAENTITMLKNIRALGIKLSIDDFGTGYSSLSYLHRFPIDTLKVDRSFVSSMEDGSENGEIVRTIIALAKTLNLDVVAEGIETIHQLHQLRILGCDNGQGYLFSRPVPVEEAQIIVDDSQRWQNIIPNNNPTIIAQNREFSYLRLAN